jgi:EpsI family protein
VDTKRFRIAAPVVIGVAACLILLAQFATSRMLSFDERTLAAPKLHEIPLSLGTWQSNGEQSLDKETVDFLNPDAYILRDYVAQDEPGSVNLFVAHFRSLDKSYGPHSPRICLPGSGWLISSSKVTSIPVPGTAQHIPVNEYVMEKSGQRILVVYWYQNDRRSWAEEYNAKLTLLPDLIRFRRSDVSLIRVIAPMQDRTDRGELGHSIGFIDLLFPHLEQRLALANS